MAKQWEYKIHYIHYHWEDPVVLEGCEQELNALGADGWELIEAMIQPSRSESNLIFHVFFLKREKA